MVHVKTAIAVLLLGNGTRRSRYYSTFKSGTTQYLQCWPMLQAKMSLSHSLASESMVYVAGDEVGLVTPVVTAPEKSHGPVMLAASGITFTS